MVSIMIMSHDNHDLLKECVARIKEHTKIPYELVIVDDASEPAYSDFEATVVRLPKRSNCCALRNVGMDMCKTDWVFWLDNDTMVDSGWYEPYLEKIKDDVGLIGQPMDSRLVRNPFLPLTQKDCMCEYQFAYDYDHNTGECDYITSYAVLVRRQAYRPTYCYNMPTPCLDPELGAVVKVNGFKVIVTDRNANLTHKGSQTPRPNGLDYLYHLKENFTRWWNFWEPHKDKVFELYKRKEVKYEHDANEPGRSQSLGTQGEYSKELENPPKYAD